MDWRPVCAGSAAGTTGRRAGLPAIWRRRLTEALADRPGVTLYGAPDAERTATVSLGIEALSLDRAEVFFRERGVVVRAGQHCAPMALQAIGAPQGTIRISFGPFNTAEQLDRIVAACDAATVDR